MKKKLLSLLLAGILSVFLLGGCDDEWSDEIDDGEAVEEAADETGDTENIQDHRPENETVDIEPVAIGSDARSVTVMIYMNGSDLETKAGEATADLSEMIDSGVGENVNVIVQTMGTKKWHDYDISSKTSQIYRVNRGELELVKDNLGQLDCTKSDTLSDFIDFGKKNYPADRYIMIFWDHGGGPVYGFGYDEWQADTASLTLDEIQKAFRMNRDIRFDIIGMDCCIMASMETCYAFAFFMIVRNLSHLDEQYISCYTVTNNCNKLFFVASYGLSPAVGRLIGRNLGRGKFEEAKRGGHDILWMNFWVHLVFGIAMVALSGWIPGFFSLEGDVAAVCSKMLVSKALLGFFAGYCIDIFPVITQGNNPIKF